MNAGKYEGNIVSVKTYKDIPYNDDEILRWYAGSKKCPENYKDVLNAAKSQCENAFNFKVCYSVYNIEFTESGVKFPFCEIRSKNLKTNLKGCQMAVIFAATIGIGMDRLIEKYNHIDMAEALCFQSIGNERVETLCDIFNKDIVNEICSANPDLRLYSNPRFSPGYGDLPLEFQKYIFDVLKCSKNIGVTLNDSLLMSPSKSVTAIIGIGAEL